MATDIYAQARFISLSAQKVRLVADLVRGKDVVDALTLLKFTPNRAAHPVSKVLASAMANGDVWASYSNYGNPPVDYCEPGSSIYSTYKGGGYATMSGTSMAAPHAAGILLLGGIKTDRTVIGDPDGNPDPIGVH